jgi:hypothetical protein
MYGTSCSFLQTHPLQSALPPVQIHQPPATSSRLPTIQSMLSPAPPSTATSTYKSPSDSQYLSPPQSNFSMSDLELLHFFTTQSVFAYLDSYSSIELFRNTVIQLAFEHPFLMHGILSLSSLHLSHLRPEKRALYQHASDTHTARALSLFQVEIGNLNPENCHACFAFSACIFTHAWAAQDVNKPSTIFFPPVFQETDSVHIQWVKLQRGTNSILHSVFPLLEKGPLECLFLPWKDLDPTRDDPLTAEEEQIFTDLPEAWRYSSLSASEKEILEDTCEKLRRTFSMLIYNPEISRLAMVMTWVSSVKDEFLLMMEKKIPQALLLAVVFCVPLKTVNDVWWMEGKSENLMRTLIPVLGEGWERWATWPVERVLGQEEWNFCALKDAHR